MSVAAPPDTQALEVRSTDLAARLAALKIENVREVVPTVLVASLEGSAMIGRLADDYLREVESSFGPLAKAAHEAHRKITAERDRLKAPADQLKRAAGALGHACNAELHRREEEQRQAQERERQRLQDEADARALDEQDAARRAIEDARQEQALQAEAVGDIATAERIIEAPIEVPVVRSAPVFLPPAPKLTVATPGQTFTEDWTFQVTDPALVPREYLRLDEVKIGRVVRAMRAQTSIPGIQAVARPRTTLHKKTGA